MSCDEAVLGELDGDVRSEYSELLLRLSAGTTAGQEVMLAGTKMDYEAVGLAGVLALDSSNRYHNPVDAARNLLNLSSESQKVSVALAGSQTTEAVNGEEYGTASVLVTFTEDAVGKNQVLIRMKQADVGVWLPQSYKCTTGEYRIY